jgi:hypothetical protein
LRFLSRLSSSGAVPDWRPNHFTPVAKDDRNKRNNDDANNRERFEHCIKDYNRFGGSSHRTIRPIWDGLGLCKVHKQPSPRPHPFHARGDCRHVAAHCHETSGTKSQYSPPALWSKSLPHLILVDAFRRIGIRRIKAKAEEIIPAAVGKGGGQILYKAVSLGRSPEMEETRVHYRTERSRELRGMQRVAHVKVDQPRDLLIGGGRLGASSGDRRLSQVHTQNPDPSARYCKGKVACATADFEDRASRRIFV